MPRPKTTEDTPLTAKQRAFVDAYLKNRYTGVRAAMVAYDTTDYWTAASIAHQNRRKPNVRKAIQDHFDKKYPPDESSVSDWALEVFSRK